MTANWKRARLGDVATIVRDIISPENIADGTSFVGLENIPTGGGFHNVRPVMNGDIQSAKFAFTELHVLYGKLRPYLAKISLPDFKGVCSTDILPVLPGKELDRRFLAHYLLQPSMVDKANSLATGANLPRLSPGALEDLELPLAPIDEQRRIADILDRADALRTKRRAALARLDELTQAIFIEMFGDPALNPKGWPMKTVGSVAAKFSDGPFGSNLKSSHYVECGIRVIRLQNIGIGRFIDEDKAYISREHFDDLRKHECIPGDLLIGTLGDPNLRACIQPDWLPLALNKADCVQFRANEALVLPSYMSALLNHPSTERLAQSLMLGQTRVRISMGRLRDLNVPVPPMIIQRKYAAWENSAAAMRAKLFHSLDATGLLFASLQDRAFRGAL